MADQSKIGQARHSGKSQCCSIEYLLQLEPTGTELLLIEHSLGAGIKDGEMEAASHSISIAGAGRAHLDRSHTPWGS